MRKTTLFVLALAVVAILAAQQQKAPNPDLGFTDTPILPGLKWHVHDPDRPHPKVVTPPATPGGAPSDAIVLFDGKDLSKWAQDGRGDEKGKIVDAKWPVKDGYFEVGANSGDLFTREKFADVQLHLEFSEPPGIAGTSQARGNSGVLFMRRYEIQVLDGFKNPTYADGQVGAIYGQWPPLANPSRGPGEWNVYDIVFEAPHYEGEKLTKPAYFTVFLNGVMLHNRKESMGPMVYRRVAQYVPQPNEDSLMLQDHHNPVRYRNIWIRRFPQYDMPERQ
jgi:hypothetical protein